MEQTGLDITCSTAVLEEEEEETKERKPLDGKRSAVRKFSLFIIYLLNIQLELLFRERERERRNDFSSVDTNVTDLSQGIVSF